MVLPLLGDQHCVYKGLRSPSSPIKIKNHSNTPVLYECVYMCTSILLMTVFLEDPTYVLHM